MSQASPLLKLVDVARRFDSPDGGAPISVLDSITLDVSAGESLAIVGPSGSGKSTLLHIIGTLDRPTSGSILLQGQELTAMNDEQIAAVRSRQVGFVFQAHYLLPQCNVLENVLVPTLALDSKAPSASTATPKSETPSSRAQRLLSRVGLGHRFSHYPGQLSGGERQRVAVVRALMNQPLLLLADEPTGALDHGSAQQLAQLLIDLNREEGVALIVVTHALDLARRMKRVFELKEGRLVRNEVPT